MEDVKTSWDAVKVHCEKKLGYTPADWQVKMWWDGKSAAKGKTMQQRETEKRNRVFHKRYVMNEVGPWDVVIRLAIDYVYEVANKNREQWTVPRLSGFVYTLLWSTFRRYVDAKDSKGKSFKGATFWMWAIERRSRYETVVSKTAGKNMQQGLNSFIKVMQQQFGGVE